MMVEPSGDMSWPFVGTASLADALERRGIDGVMLAGARGEGSFAGPAVTVDVVIRPPGQREEVGRVDQSAVAHALDAAAPGSVLVICTHAERFTVVGGVAAATALGRGLAGIVTDGGIRDTDEIQEYGMPIRYVFSDPRAMRNRPRLYTSGAPVRFGDVDVAPGDIVVGDRDGVLCVPRHLADALFDEARAEESRERLWAASSRLLGSVAAGREAMETVVGRSR